MTSVKSASFGLLFLAMKPAVVALELQCIIQKGIEKPVMKAALFACTFCYLGCDASEVIGVFSWVFVL